jgi:Raf kinase inhibitor-like YbhB/YbcL family protein
MPLYDYARDASPGQTNGQGITAFGGTWTVATPLGSGAAPAAVGAQGAPTTAPMTISSPRIPNGSVIPTDYVCTDEQGMNKSPQLLFSNIPSNAQSLVLKVDDPDAPNGYNATGNYPQAIVHWLLYNMAPTTSGIPEGAASPPGTAGASYDGTPNYQGPCPPMGTHRYFFRLYALNGPISPGVTPIPTAVPPNTASSWPDVMSAMAGKVVACATLVGIRASGPNQPTGNPALPAPPVDNLCPTQPINNVRPSGGFIPPFYFDRGSAPHPDGPPSGAWLFTEGFAVGPPLNRTAQTESSFLRRDERSLSCVRCAPFGRSHPPARLFFRGGSAPHPDRAVIGQFALH